MNILLFKTLTNLKAQNKVMFFNSRFNLSEKINFYLFIIGFMKIQNIFAFLSKYTSCYIS